MVELQLMVAWWASTATRILQRARRKDGGEVQGWVIVVAITVALAIGVGAIIVAKVTAKANSIDLQ
jgi:hypothetical protein